MLPKDIRSMYHVLIAADGNVNRVRKQVDAVTQLPDSERVKATIIHVFEESAIDDSSDMVDPMRLDAVKTAKESLEEHGIDVSVEGRIGDPSSTVISIAEEIEADSIFVGGPKRSPAGKAIFGSVSQSIILNADRPVMVTIDR